LEGRDCGGKIVRIALRRLWRTLFRLPVRPAPKDPARPTPSSAFWRMRSWRTFARRAARPARLAA